MCIMGRRSISPAALMPQGLAAHFRKTHFSVFLDFGNNTHRLQVRIQTILKRRTYMGNYDTLINFVPDATEITTENKMLQSFVRKKSAENPEYFAGVEDQGDKLKFILNDAKYDFAQFTWDMVHDED